VRITCKDCSGSSICSTSGREYIVKTVGKCRAKQQKCKRKRNGRGKRRKAGGWFSRRHPPVPCPVGLGANQVKETKTSEPSSSGIDPMFTKYTSKGSVGDEAASVDMRHTLADGYSSGAKAAVENTRTTASETKEGDE